VKVLVTGGCGFVGSHIVDALVEQGHDVRVLDRQPPSHPNNGARYTRADLVEPESWAHVVDGIEAVSHQAARVGLGVHFAEVADYVRDNDLGTAMLLRVLDQARFAGRLVLASSMVVYGEGAYDCPRCGPVRPAPRTAERLAAGLFEPLCPACGDDLQPVAVEEEAPCDPRNVYAATKVHQEHLCAAFGRESGARVVALRYHNVYGPRAPLDTPYAGVASIFLGALHREEAPRVFEDGGQRRDFVHVRDVARANLAALTAPLTRDQAFNVASGTPRTIGELAAGLWEVAGRGGPEPIVTGQWRLGDVRHVFASPRRAATTVGFEARVPFGEGLAELADCFARSA
jgi:dTDP-L-rhamnose 4-epimerase